MLVENSKFCRKSNMVSRKFLLLCNLMVSRPKMAPPKITHQIVPRFQSTGAQVIIDCDETKDDSVGMLHPFAKVNEAQKAYLEELGPPMKRSFNLAAYVNRSKTLQELVKLGVSLYDIENTNKTAARNLLSLDFERDCVRYIQFLVDNGLKERNLGRFISEYPMIFNEHLDDLQVRINYLESKGFSKTHIAKALNRSSCIVSQKTKTLDFQLGQLQIEFGLPADLIRCVVARYPPVVCLPVMQYKLVNFTLIEEFGFKVDEVHQLLKSQPELLDILRPILIARLDLVHNTIGLSHSMIVKFPKLITGPRSEIEHRFNYLKKLNRNQFNPEEPLYVPPSSLYNMSDEQFCVKYTKTSLDDFKLFLKSC